MEMDFSIRIVMKRGVDPLGSGPSSSLIHCLSLYIGSRCSILSQWARLTGLAWNAAREVLSWGGGKEEGELVSPVPVSPWVLVQL